MADKSTVRSQVKKNGFGLANWMHEVLKTHKLASQNMSPNAVHDLRVSLRRCRSMVDGLMEVDDYPGWKKFKKTARNLFKSLGALRDTHVMIGWVKKLAPKDNRARKALLKILRSRKKNEEKRAKRKVESFDRKKWKAFSKTLPERAERRAKQRKAFAQLALRRYEDAYAFYQTALQNPEDVTGWHQLRVGIKRFRYTIENFLPEFHKRWGKDLETIQDLLGDVHDLDMLWEALDETGKVFDQEEHRCWRAWIDEQRDPRMVQCQALFKGSQSRWRLWKRDLKHNPPRSAAKAGNPTPALKNSDGTSRPAEKA